MVIIKKIVLLAFLCSLPIRHAAANQFPVNVNGWKLAALIPACATVFFAADWHAARVTYKYLDYLREKVPGAFSQIPYSEKSRQELPVGAFFSALCAAGCATATGLLYYIGTLRQ